MNIKFFPFPKIDTQTMFSGPINLTQQAWSSLGNIKFQLPRIEANFLTKTTASSKPLMEMRGNLHVRNFDFKKSLTLSKLAPYAR